MSLRHISSLRSTSSTVHQETLNRTLFKLAFTLDFDLTDSDLIVNHSNSFLKNNNEIKDTNLTNSNCNNIISRSSSSSSSVLAKLKSIIMSGSSSNGSNVKSNLIKKKLINTFPNLLKGKEANLNNVAELIQEGKVKNVIIMVSSWNKSLWKQN